MIKKGIDMVALLIVILSESAPKKILEQMLKSNYRCITVIYIWNWYIITDLSYQIDEL